MSGTTAIDSIYSLLKMKKTWQSTFLIVSLPVLKQLRDFLILYLAVFLFVYSSMAQLSELTVACRILPANPYFFSSKKICVFERYMLPKCCFLQLFLARHVKPELLFFQVYGAGF